MSKLPFTVYDFFAYLSSGAILVGAVDLTFGPGWLRQTELSAVQSWFLLFLSYMVGHAVAHLSSLILEDGLVDRVLHRPSLVLMGEAGVAPPWKRLFRPYEKALPSKTRERVRERLAARGHPGLTGEDLFLHAFGIVKQQDDTAERLEQFRNLYGFARNATLALLLAGILMGVASVAGHAGPGGAWALVSMLGAVVMLYRYLKFFRQYSFEVLVSYAETQP